MKNYKDQEHLTNILPYDFVKENDVLAFNEGDSFSVISPNSLSDDIYHEIQRFLKSTRKEQIKSSKTKEKWWFKASQTSKFQLI